MLVTTKFPLHNNAGFQKIYALKMLKDEGILNSIYLKRKYYINLNRNNFCQTGWGNYIYDL